MTNTMKFIATFAAGCFWGIEAEFRQQLGVVNVTVGYTGGQTENPSYEQVCRGKTGHAEAVQIEFNPNLISYEDLLNVFWNCHDATQVNRQGPDIGTQYRSAIFYHNDEQHELAEATKTAHANYTGHAIATELTEASKFYPAEDYHQRYFEKNNIKHCPLK
tara:strand:- start:22721 stop:23203 length:483 start_codon:yes stop_codon:yes gene_type:complete